MSLEPYIASLIWLRDAVEQVYTGNVISQKWKREREFENNIHPIMQNTINGVWGTGGIRADFKVMEKRNSNYCDVVGTNIVRSRDAIILMLPNFEGFDESAFNFIFKDKTYHIKENTNLMSPLVAAISAFVTGILLPIGESASPVLFFITLGVSLIARKIFNVYSHMKSHEFAIKHGTDDELVGALHYYIAIQQRNIRYRSASYSNSVRYTKNGDDPFIHAHFFINQKIKMLETALDPDHRNVEYSIDPNRVQNITTLLEWNDQAVREARTNAFGAVGRGHNGQGYRNGEPLLGL